jgi:hypothetical protein
MEQYNKCSGGMEGNMLTTQYIREEIVYPTRLIKMGNFAPFLSTNGPYTDEGEHQIHHVSFNSKILLH